MSDDLLREIRALKQTLTSLQDRITELEQKAIAAPPPAAPSVSKAVEHPKPIPPLVAPEISKDITPCPKHPERAVRWVCAKCRTPLCSDCGGVAFQSKVFCRECDKAAASASPSAAAPAAAPAAILKKRPPELVKKKAEKSGETFETRIGRYWLNRIGITSLVLGVAFFILYTFQYFGPAMKILIGAAISGGLLGAGVWLERRPALRWYGRGLIGGGWALLYFTVFAMYHIPAVRILDAAWVDLCLLLAVTVGAVGHSLKYRSETITVLALLLGFVTTSISTVTYFTLASSILLVAALVWLVVKMGWDRLYLYGVLASYATHLLWVQPQITRSLAGSPEAGLASFWLSAAFLTLYWVAYHLALFGLNEKKVKTRNRLLTATLVNAGMFAFTMLSSMSPFYPESKYIFAMVVGAVYVFSDWAIFRKNLPTIRAAHALIGMSLLALAVFLKISDRWFCFWWLLQGGLVLWLGLRYAHRPYRLFAFCLMLVSVAQLLLQEFWRTFPVTVFAWEVPWRVVIGIAAITAFSLAAALYRLPRFRGALQADESRAFHAYFLAAALLTGVLTALEVNTAWIPAAWATEAAVAMALGFWLKDSGVRAIATIGFGITALRLFGNMGMWDVWPTACLIAVVYGVSWLYRLASSRTNSKSARAQDSYAIAALLILTILLHDEVSRQWIPLVWSLEMTALATLGLALKERPFRLFAFWLTIAVLFSIMVYHFYPIPRMAQTSYPPFVLFGFAIPWRIFVGSVAIAAFGLTAAWYRLPRFKDSLQPFEAEGFRLYFFSAAAILWMLIRLEAPAEWVASGLAAEAAAVTWLGFLLKDKVVRLMGAAGFGMALLRLLGTYNDWNLLATAPAVAFGYAMGLTYRRLEPSEQQGIEGNLQNAYTIAASVLLTALVGTEASRQWISVAWAVEGLALIAAGFALRDKIFRVSGLLVFGLLILKILFVDLAGAETIYRILSFIVAGAMLLAASYGYATFSKSGDKE